MQSGAAFPATFPHPQHFQYRTVTYPLAREMETSLAVIVVVEQWRSIFKKALQNVCNAWLNPPANLRVAPIPPPNPRENGYFHGYFRIGNGGNPGTKLSSRWRLAQNMALISATRPRAVSRVCSRRRFLRSGWTVVVMSCGCRVCGSCYAFVLEFHPFQQMQFVSGAVD